MADACPELADGFSAAVLEAARGRSAAARLLVGAGVRLPGAVAVRRPEGFCDYGVTVESYARAADGFWEARRPERATVIGIRTIGTTLSAVVAARLEERGCAMVRRFTVRPEGHPYHRVVRLFEAAGAGACLITDAFAGVEEFFRPGEEILVARDGAEVARLLRELSPERARAIGDAARRRALGSHTYRQRAALWAEAVGEPVGSAAR